MLAQHVAGNSKPELVYSAIFAPTNDELFLMLWSSSPLDGRAIYMSRTKKYSATHEMNFKTTVQGAFSGKTVTQNVLFEEVL